MPKTKTANAAPSHKPKPTKLDDLTALMSGADGATLDELTAATGWLPHTVRAAVSGLRKKGYSVERTRVEGTSRWRITKSGAQ